MEIQNDLDQSLVSLTQEEFENIDNVIRKDCLFLKNNNLLDYSLFLTIEEVPCTKEEWEKQQK